MSNHASDRLEEIRAMLATGHRSIQLEGHTLKIWGLAGAVLCVVSDWLITPEVFPERWQIALAELILIGGVLLFAGVLDYVMTRRARSERDESISFVHRQVYKIWWLLMTMGVAITLGTLFFGGGHMIYGIWLVLIGTGLFVHGLFSERVLELGGILVILVGVGSVALLSYPTTRWLAAAVLGIGLPLLAYAPLRTFGQRRIRQIVAAGAWLIAVLIPAYTLNQLVVKNTVPDATPVSLDEFRKDVRTTGLKIITLPQGTSIPVRILVEGNVLKSSDAKELAITLAKPVDIVLKDGVPEGRFRVEDGHWQDGWTGMRLYFNKFDSTLSAESGPHLTVRAMFNAGK